MGFARTAVGVLFLSVLVFYLATVGQLTDEAKWGFVGAMGVLAFLWINLEPHLNLHAHLDLQRLAPRNLRRSLLRKSRTVEEEEEDELPAPVMADSLDGATLRERKLAKIAAAEAAKASAVVEVEADEEVMIEVELEEVHVAGEYVVDVSPESVEDADIELTVRDRRERHEAIREHQASPYGPNGRHSSLNRSHVGRTRFGRRPRRTLCKHPVTATRSWLSPNTPSPWDAYGATFVRSTTHAFSNSDSRWTLGLNPLVQPKQGNRTSRSHRPGRQGIASASLSRRYATGPPAPSRSQQCA